MGFSLPEPECCAVLVPLCQSHEGITSEASEDFD